MNSYSDSGYQDAGSYYSSQNVGRTGVRLQHSYQSSGPVDSGTLLRNSRAEGQASSQVGVIFKYDTYPVYCVVYSRIDVNVRLAIDRTEWDGEMDRFYS